MDRESHQARVGVYCEQGVVVRETEGLVVYAPYSVGCLYLFTASERQQGRVYKAARVAFPKSKLSLPQLPSPR